MFSLNEIAATAKKATRGAGYPWGVADEAGFAVKWLTSHGVDGCAVLASFLETVDARDRKLVNDRGAVSAPAGQFQCPILAGCTLSDFGPAEYQFAAIPSPILMVPFVSIWGRAMIETATGRVLLDGSAVRIEGDFDDIATNVSVTPNVNGTVVSSPKNRANPDNASWDILLTFAHRTYAPATEESRLKGAG